MKTQQTIDWAKERAGKPRDGYHQPETDITEAWRLYEAGKDYNNRLTPNQYNLVNTNIEFFAGNQWINLPQGSAMSSLPKPVFNVIKRIASLFVASLTSTSSRVSYEPLSYRADSEDDNPDEDVNAAKMATAEVDNLFDKFKMDFRIREALFDGIQTGDYCAHFYWDPTKIPYGGAFSSYRGEICMELVDGINVMFGNPNTHIVDDQPYILIIGRDTVENLQLEYEKYHPRKSGESFSGKDSILSDYENEWQAGSGGKIELEEGDKSGKALVIYMYRKVTKLETVKDENGEPVMVEARDENGKPIILRDKKGNPITDEFGVPEFKYEPLKDYVTTIHVSKHTKQVSIFDDIDTGLTYYPIAWGNWERQKNQYHGRALVTEIIPNQIYINSMFALIMRHQQMMGFPKTLYDADVIGQWTNAVGQAIAVRNLPQERRMSDLHSVIQPADMSTQIMGCIEMAMQYTKECLGATDAQLGNVKPENTSALIALQSSAQVPLENPQALKYEWVEDCGRILLDMMGTYYGQRPVIVEEEISQEGINPTTGQPTTITSSQKVIKMFDFKKLKGLWLNVRADVGASTYWSKIAVVQTLDNLKRDGLLDIIDYLERMPDEYVPLKEQLISKYKNLMANQQINPQNGGNAVGTGTPTGGASGDNTSLSTASLVSTLTPDMQGRFEDMPTKAQNALLTQVENQRNGLV